MKPTPQEEIFMDLKDAFRTISFISTRQFYWASRNTSEVFTEDKADKLFRIIQRGTGYASDANHAYFTGHLLNYSFKYMKEWAEHVENNLDLYRKWNHEYLHDELQKLEKCFEAITSNDWVF